MKIDDVKRILVVGAGQMGAQIAMQSALSGYECTLNDLAVTRNDKDRPPRELEKRVTRGDLGRKTGRGFYDYSTDPPTPILD